jgi:vancomycin permeability regulator SanA
MAMMPAPPVMNHDRSRSRRRHHHWRGRRSGRGRRRRRAGSQCESRNQSGRAERPACRDKTHVSPPRVESDTLYQLDTQSRAAQDMIIIASSRLFSMGNLTSIRSMPTILIFGAAIRSDGKPSATLRRRVEAALNCARNHSDVRFIPTGAAGRYGPSEASVMAGLLIKSGVGSERILLEETGHDTLSSVRAIYRLLREQPHQGHVLVASSSYHLPRCVTLLCISGIAAKRCPSPPQPVPSKPWNRWYWRLREVPALPYDAALALFLRLTGKL